MNFGLIGLPSVTYLVGVEQTVLLSVRLELRRNSERPVGLINHFVRFSYSGKAARLLAVAPFGSFGDRQGATRFSPCLAFKAPRSKVSFTEVFLEALNVKSAVFNNNCARLKLPEIHFPRNNFTKPH